MKSEIIRNIMRNISGASILVISDTDSPHTNMWVKYFINKGYKIDIISYSDCKIEGANVYHIKSRFRGKFKYFETAWQVRRIVRKLKPDILHIHYITGRGLLGLVANYHPLVISVWGSDVAICPNQSIFHRIVVKMITRMADVINSPSKHITIKLIKMRNRKEKIRTFQYGVETRSIDKIESASKNMNQIVIVSPRNWHPLLNVDKIIMAMSYVINEVDNIKLIVVGKEDNKERIKYEKIIEVHSLSNCVELRGMINKNNFYSLLKACDILISVPSTDGSPLSVVEGIYCGCIPILSDIEAYRGWEKKYWYERTNTNPEDIATAIVNVIHNKTRWKEIIEKNEMQVIKCENWDINMTKMELIYQELLVK